MTRPLLIILAALAASPALAQADSAGTSVFKQVLVSDPGGPPGDTWTRLFGDGRSAAALAVSRTYDGGYILSGWRINPVTLRPDMYVVKTDSAGNSDWERTIGTGAESQEAYAVRQTASGGYVVAAWRDFTSVVLGLDSVGNTQWERDLFAGDTCIDFGGGSDLVPTSDGGYAAVSAVSGRHLQGIGRHAEGVVLTKLDSAGNRQWRELYEGELTKNAPAGLRQCHDGGYVICCTRHGSGAWLVRTDSTGAIEWSRSYPNAEFIEATSVREGQDRGFIVAGASRSDTSWFWSTNLSLMRTDSLGNLVWRRDYGDSAADDVGYAVEFADDGGYVACGYTQSPLDFRLSAYIVSVDSAGELWWSSKYGGQTENDARAIVSVGGGDWVVCGQGFYSPATDKYFAYLRRLHPSWK